MGEVLFLGEARASPSQVHQTNTVQRVNTKYHQGCCEKKVGKQQKGRPGERDGGERPRKTTTMEPKQTSLLGNWRLGRRVSPGKECLFGRFFSAFLPRLPLLVPIPGVMIAAGSGSGSRSRSS